MSDKNTPAPAPRTDAAKPKVTAHDFRALVGRRILLRSTMPVLGKEFISFHEYAVLAVSPGGLVKVCGENASVGHWANPEHLDVAEVLP